MDLEHQALLESPWGQSILEEGERIGEQRGREEGGRRFIQRLLRRRFGEVPELVETTLQRLNMEQLEELGECLIEVNSLDEFMAALPPLTEE
ncbi:DUF4351 domain-containing protein [Oscillatoria sp. HE19RPO]|uniref:DUF4351 domain-containing protein n=1 Tax=Oscillatoria sp. HE19RPO TaxID=2954806 RepID=UPI0020C3DB4A|nr:DUF4351 domain-containing protein [Oscillatoria sp. HE19RPO]